MFSNKKNEITLIYNGNDLDDTQALSYLKSLNHYKLKTINVLEENLSKSQISHLAHQMGVGAKSMIDQNSTIKKDVEEKDLSEDDILKLIEKYPDALRTPITLWKGHTEYWDTAYDMIKLEMKFN